jgi:hypothetical protein
LTRDAEGLEMGKILAVSGEGSNARMDKAGAFANSKWRRTFT